MRMQSPGSGSVSGLQIWTPDRDQIRLGGGLRSPITLLTFTLSLSVNAQRKLITQTELRVIKLLEIMEPVAITVFDVTRL